MPQFVKMLVKGMSSPEGRKAAAETVELIFTATAMILSLIEKTKRTKKDNCKCHCKGKKK